MVDRDDSEYVRRKDDSKAAWWILGILAVIAILFVVPLAANRNLFDSQNQPEREPGVLGIQEEIGEDEFGPGSAQTIDDIVNNPDRYDGQQVSVTAEMEETIDEHALTLEAPGMAPDKDLLVLTSGSLIMDDDGLDRDVYADDDVVRVSGIVRMFNRTQMEEELNLTLDEEVFNDYDGKPVIVADSVSVVQVQ